MKVLSKKEYLKLPIEKREEYLRKYLEHLLNISVVKTRSTENFALSSWPYIQACEVGSQKIILKIQKLVSND